MYVNYKEPECRLAQRRALHAEYLRRLYHREAAYDYVDVASGRRFSAHIVDVAPSGEITLRTAEGALRHYYFKEVRFVVPPSPVSSSVAHV